MSRPPVYALVLNYNCWRDTIECIASLRRVAYPALHVIVLDGGSTDDSVARIREAASQEGVTLGSIDGLATGGLAPPPSPVVALVPLNANLGFAGANNVGLRYVLTRETDAFAWVLNADTVVSPDALDAMVTMAERDPNIGLLGATLLRQDQPETVETAGGGTVASWHGMTQTIRDGTKRTDPRPDPRRMDFVSGTCMLVRRTAIERVGLMDERFFLYGEDIDWSIRFRQLGYRTAYCGAAEVWHKGGGSTVHRSATHDYYNIKSALLLVHKHSPWALPLAFGYSVARCVLPKLVRGNWSRIPAALRAYADFFRQVTRRPNAVAGT